MIFYSDYSVPTRPPYLQRNQPPSMRPLNSSSLYAWFKISLKRNAWPWRPLTTKRTSQPSINTAATAAVDHVANEGKESHGYTSYTHNKRRASKEYVAKMKQEYGNYWITPPPCWKGNEMDATDYQQGCCTNCHVTDVYVESCSLCSCWVFFNTNRWYDEASDNIEIRGGHCWWIFATKVLFISSDWKLRANSRVNSSRLFQRTIKNRIEYKIKNVAHWSRKWLKPHQTTHYHSRQSCQQNIIISWQYRQPQYYIRIIKTVYRPMFDGRGNGGNVPNITKHQSLLIQRPLIR